MKIAEDPTVLRIASQATSSPTTLLLFAAVHFLLLQGARHSLFLYYPGLNPEACPEDDPYPDFQSFCLIYEAAILDILKSRRLQTNEVRRCSYLALGLSVVAKEAARDAGRYAMIDVGSSAGLHLLWPRYGYDYDGFKLGDRSSPVQLTCRLEGRRRPRFPESWELPVEQAGIDLHPLRPNDPDDQTWLGAMIWPEHSGRRELLDRALSIAQSHPPRVVTGDVLQRLPDLIGDMPRDLAVCICHNHTLNQFQDSDRMRFDKMLAGLAHDRDIYRLAAEWIGTEKTELTLSHYRNGEKSHRLLARVDDHGAWLQWAETHWADGTAS